MSVEAIYERFKEFKGDKWILLAYIALCVVSLLSVYSAVGSMVFKNVNDTSAEIAWLKHLIFVLIGVVCMLYCYRQNYMVFSKIAPYLLIISIVLLILTLWIGTEKNDARRWLTIPLIDMDFQTSDVARIAIVLYLARELALRQEVIKGLFTGFVPLIWPIGIIFILIAPANLSTSLMVLVSCFVMMFVGRIAIKYMAIACGLGVLLLVSLYSIASYFPDLTRNTTWEHRIENYLAGDSQEDGLSQQSQAKIAIATGGIFGKGPGASFQRNYLPYAYADFIFAIICEEYGIVGAIIVMLLYLIILYRCVSLVIRSRKVFASMLIIGLGMNIVFQAITNMGVSTQLFPATGLTLPLVSAGGTSLILTSISIGMVLSASRHIDDHLTDAQSLDRIDENKLVD